MAKTPEDEIKTIPGEGDVPITIKGEELYLRPTLGACLTISRMSGGMQKTMDRLMSLDVDALVQVIAAGLGKPVTRELQAAVYESGLFVIRIPAMRFITVINNGGKPVTDDSEGEDDNDDENPPTDDLPL